MGINICKGILRIKNVILGAAPRQMCWETQVEPVVFSKTRQEPIDAAAVSSSVCYSAIPQKPPLQTLLSDDTVYKVTTLSIKPPVS